MGLTSRFSRKEKDEYDSQHTESSSPRPGPDTEKGLQDDGPLNIWNMRVIAMILIVSIGGMIFGYDTGQISGFLEMKNFLGRFGEDGSFSAARSGTIVGLVGLP